MRIKIDIQLLDWANRMNSKPFHAWANRDKRECPVFTLSLPRVAVLNEIRTYHAMPAIKSGLSILEWAIDHKLVERHPINKSLDLTVAGEILLGLFKKG